MQYLSPILGLVGLDQQYNQNQEAQHQAQAQLAQQQQMEAAQEDAYNNYRSNVGRLQQEGAYNPAARLQELGQQGSYDLQNALSSEAGAARALGYRPGDTVPITEMNQTMGNYNLQQEQAANQILNQSNANYLAALQGAPSLSDLGAGIGASSENARTYLGQMEGMGGMLGALGPYLKNQNGQPGSQAQSAANQASGGTYDYYQNVNGGLGSLADGQVTASPSPTAPTAPAQPTAANNAAANNGINGQYTAPIMQGNMAEAPQSISAAPGGMPSAAIQSIGVIPAVSRANGTAYGLFGAPQSSTQGSGLQSIVQASAQRQAPSIGVSSGGSTTTASGGFGGSAQRPKYQMPPVWNL